MRKLTVEQSKANGITYMVQDMLDNLSRGKPFVFKEFEKSVLSVIKNPTYNQ